MLLFKPLRLILAILMLVAISCQTNGQEFSERLEEAYQHNSQFKLRKILKEYAEENPGNSYDIPDFAEDFFDVYYTIVLGSNCGCSKWENPSLQIPRYYKRKIFVIQSQLIFGRTDSSSIDFEMDLEKIKFDTIRNFIRIEKNRNPWLLLLTAEAYREFEKFINLENRDLDELAEEIEKQYNRDIRRGSITQDSIDQSLILHFKDGKSISYESFLRQITSIRRIKFLNKQLSMTVGDVNKGIWNWKIYSDPEISYMIMDYSSKRLKIVSYQTASEYILEKNREGHWIIKDWTGGGL